MKSSRPFRSEIQPAKYARNRWATTAIAVLAGTVGLVSIHSIGGEPPLKKKNADTQWSTSRNVAAIQARPTDQLLLMRDFARLLPGRSGQGSIWTTSEVVSTDRGTNGATTDLSSGPQSPKLAGSRSQILRICGSTGDDRIHITESNGIVYVVLITPTNTIDYSIARSELNENHPQFCGAILITGDLGDDIIVNDTNIDCGIDGHEGSDVIIGGFGDDVLWGYHGSDIIFGRSGEDWIAGHEGNDILNGGYPPAGAVAYPGQFDLMVFLGDIDGLVTDFEEDWLNDTGPHAGVNSDGYMDFFYVEWEQDGMISWLIDKVSTDDPLDAIQ